jgi:hypothetical protein
MGEIDMLEPYNLLQGIGASGLKVVEIELAKSEGHGFRGWLRGPAREVPTTLVPSFDEVVVLRTPDAGYLDLGWGQKPNAESPEWLTAYGATKLRRQCRDRMQLHVPSNSIDLEFSVTVECDYELRDPTRFLENAGRTSTRYYRDNIERLVHELGADHDPVLPADLRTALTARLKAWIRVRPEEIPGVAVEFGRVGVKTAEAVVKHVEEIRIDEWSNTVEEQRSRTRRAGIGRYEAERSAIAASKAIEVEDEEELTNRRTDHVRRRADADDRARLDRRRREVEADRADDLIRLQMERDRATAELERTREQATVLLELLAESYGPEAVAIARGELSAGDVANRKTDDMRWEEAKLYSLLSWIVKNDPDGDIDLGEVGTGTIKAEIDRLLKRTGGLAENGAVPRPQELRSRSDVLDDERDDFDDEDDESEPEEDFEEAEVIEEPPDGDVDPGSGSECGDPADDDVDDVDADLLGDGDDDTGRAADGDDG